MARARSSGNLHDAGRRTRPHLQPSGTGACRPDLAPARTSQGGTEVEAPLAACSTATDATPRLGRSSVVRAMWPRAFFL